MDGRALMSDDSTRPSILFAAGGTGGHLFPAIAIAEEIKSLRPTVHIIFVGTKNKIEADVAPKKGFAFATIWISGFHRRLTAENLLFPLKVIVSLVQSFFLMRKEKPGVVVGTGGYVCGPILYVASVLGIPTAVHESNSYPGVTTRLLASRVTKLFLTFDVTKRWLGNADAEKAEVTGTPTRASLGTVTQKEGRHFFSLDPEKKTLLVFGGSLGAASINSFIDRIGAELSKHDIQLIWQTGATDFERYRSKKDNNRWIGKFIEKMEFGYAAADVVLCRSGATTLAELTRLGKPAILVPYPLAAANHQELNAQTMLDAGAALMVMDSELGVKGLRTITETLSDKNLLATMHLNSLRLGKPNAGKEIAERILSLLPQRP